jgi:formyl-CoA transferase
MAAIGREDLADDPRFRHNADRIENAAELDAIIEEWTRQRTTEGAISTMEQAGAIVGPVYDIADVFEDEQFAAREDLISVSDDDLGEVTTHAPVPKFSKTPGEVDRLGGERGQHNDEIYRERLGLGNEEYRQLREKGVI